MKITIPDFNRTGTLSVLYMEEEDETRRYGVILTKTMSFDRSENSPLPTHEDLRKFVLNEFPELRPRRLQFDFVPSQTLTDISPVIRFDNTVAGISKTISYFYGDDSNYPPIRAKRNFTHDLDSKNINVEL